jgi:hypothetical protein
MSRDLLGRIAWLAAATSLVGRGPAAGEPWRALEQPELKRALEKAPVLKDVLVRIDPKDAGVHVVGKIAPVGYPTFVGRDIYLSGPEQLRRIRNVVPAP